MEVVALGPFYVASLPWQRQSREWVLTVVCKATFDLAPGELRLSSGQEPINDADNHWDDDPRRSVYSPSDLVPFRKGADVTLVGHAFAAHHQPCRSLLARLVVGSLDKAIEVHADRTWSGEAQITDGPAFTHMPLRYERAQGGAGTMNPVGIPVAPGPLPNLHPARRQHTLKDDGSPVGFGPIAAGWPQRETRLRRHRGSFSHAEWHTRPLPDDIEIEYFNAAPADQRLPEITPDLEIVLEHLHPDHPRLTTRLPGLRPQAFVERPRGGAQELNLVGDALWIDTDRAICTVTWRGQMPLLSRDERGRVLVAMGAARQKLGWDDVQMLIRALAPQKSSTPAQPAQPAAPAPAPAAPAPAAPAAAKTAPPVPPKPARPAEQHIFEEESVETEIISTEELARAEGVNLPAWLAQGRARGGASARPPAAAPAPAPAPAPTSAAAPVPPPVAATNPVTAPRTPTQPPRTPLPFPAVQPPAPAQVVPPMPPVPAISAAPAVPPAPAIPVAPPFTPPQATPVPPAEVPRREPLDVTPAPASPRETSPWAAGASANVIGAPTHTPVAAPVATTPAAQDDMRPRVPPARPSRRLGPEVVDLLWFDPQGVARVRAAFPAIVDELEFEPLDPKHDLPTDDPNASRDRHDTFGVLTRATPTDGRGIQRAMLESISETGRFTPPVVMLTGELRFPFDEVEHLQAAVAAVTPLVTEDNKKLKDALEAANEVLKTPLLQAPSNVEAVTSELRDAVRQSKRSVTVTQLDAHIERVLLDQRKYQKRIVFGDEQIRALCVPAGENTTVPVYLPQILAMKLPLMLKMKARLLAEAHAQQDQYESHPNALRVLALGRVVSIDGWR
ncbi:DUF2169 family type VI secretion system accessory protein [Polyangium sorediatum]|uniref:DUF2169 domain-containing protein n=1 Tax=Polyangium sorediatum TaxID=889274 RepID=A0ABT6NMM4_9BACT|nr:DUF2169 domain-containing protein [Polyangium sorediatum]MDI1429559.1 DUF2169 domain-containing protein [Polyangium sorediatum]